jgi:hypothetical protein
MATLNFTLQPNTPIKILVHEVGAELGVILNYWTTTPHMVNLQKDDVSVDVIVHKEIDIVNDRCNDSSEYNYFSTDFYKTENASSHKPRIFPYFFYFLKTFLLFKNFFKNF